MFWRGKSYVEEVKILFLRVGNSLLLFRMSPFAAVPAKHLARLFYKGKNTPIVISPDLHFRLERNIITVISLAVGPWYQRGIPNLMYAFTPSSSPLVRLTSSRIGLSTLILQFCISCHGVFWGELPTSARKMFLLCDVKMSVICASYMNILRSDALVGITVHVGEGRVGGGVWLKWGGGLTLPRVDFQMSLSLFYLLFHFISSWYFPFSSHRAPYLTHYFHIWRIPMTKQLPWLWQRKRTSHDEQ